VDKVKTEPKYNIWPGKESNLLCTAVKSTLAVVNQVRKQTDQSYTNFLQAATGFLSIAAVFDIRGKLVPATMQAGSAWEFTTLQKFNFLYFSKKYNK